MYIPTSFAETDIGTLHEFIERHSFATLITVGESGTVASHLPLLLDRDSGPQGKLIGHVARANTQWKGADASAAFVIFHGPHTYISPSWYEEQNVVPTWNYVAVHVYGTLRIVSDRATLLQTLRDTVRKYESSAADPWSIDEPESQFIDKLLDSIVGFEIDINRMEGKWKLSQNHTPERRSQVVEALRARGDEQSTAIANLMSATVEENDA